MMHLIDMKEVIRIKKSKGKFRYFYFLDKRRNKEILKEMLLKRYKILPYPKGENKRYLIDKTVPQQKQL